MGIYHSNDNKIFSFIDLKCVTCKYVMESVDRNLVGMDCPKCNRKEYVCDGPCGGFKANQCEQKDCKRRACAAYDKEAYSCRNCTEQSCINTPMTMQRVYGYGIGKVAGAGDSPARF